MVKFNCVLFFLLLLFMPIPAGNIFSFYTRQGRKQDCLEEEEVEEYARERREEI